MSDILSVVIVNYNSFHDCCRCLGSILRNNIALEKNIVVVDNASPDNSGPELRDKYPNVNVILNEKNNGFGGGVNVGVNSTSTPYVLILNPDTYFKDNSINGAIDTLLSDGSVGVVGLRLENVDGSLQYSARRFYSLMTVILRRASFSFVSKFRDLENEHLMLSSWGGERFEADWVMGTGFVVRKKAFDDVSGMDEKYFLYLEDTDFCFRLWQSGWKVLVEPNASLVHAHQRASSGGLLSWAGRVHARSLIRYCMKHGLPVFGHGKRP